MFCMQISPYIFIVSEAMPTLTDFVKANMSLMCHPAVDGFMEILVRQDAKSLS